MGTGKAHWLQKERAGVPSGPPRLVERDESWGYRVPTGRGSRPARVPIAWCESCPQLSGSLIARPAFSFLHQKNLKGQGRVLHPQQTLRDAGLVQVLFPGQHFAGNVAGVYLVPSTFWARDSGPTRGTHPPHLLPALHVPACTHNGKTYSHGEVWHPTVLSFGPMPCILCTCVDGDQACHRVTCPTQYPCSQPKKVAGKCCKICPGRRGAEGRGGIGHRYWEPWGLER